MEYNSKFEKEVLVLIPSYNRPKELALCIERLQYTAGDGEYDLMVVDDCSPMEQEVYGVVERQIATHSNVQLIKTPQNGGFTKCVNYGISYLWSHKRHYKYMLLLNNDAQVGTGWIDKMTAGFTDPLNVGVVAPYLAVWCPDSIYPSPIGWNKPYRTEGHPFAVRDAMIKEFPNNYWYEEHVGFWGVMIRFDLFKQYGLFDERFQVICQDLDWCFRISKYGWKIKVYHDLQNPNSHVIWHHGKTHMDLKPKSEIDPKCEQDNRLVREIWPEKWNPR